MKNEKAAKAIKVMITGVRTELEKTRKEVKHWTGMNILAELLHRESILSRYEDFDFDSGVSMRVIIIELWRDYTRHEMERSISEGRVINYMAKRDALRKVIRAFIRIEARNFDDFTESEKELMVAVGLYNI